MKKTRSVREMVINFVKNNGPQPHATLRDIVLIASNQPLNRRNYGTSYIDNVSYGSSALLPTNSDSQYLVKSPVDGLYHYVAE